MAPPPEAPLSPDRQGGRAHPREPLPRPHGHDEPPLAAQPGSHARASRHDTRRTRDEAISTASPAQC